MTAPTDSLTSEQQRGEIGRHRTGSMRRSTTPWSLTTGGVADAIALNLQRTDRMPEMRGTR